MTIRETTKYRLRYFDNFQFYDYKADWYRFQTIENQLEAALSVTGGGVLRGWDVSTTDIEAQPFSITISPGSGIIPFLINSFIINEELSKLDRQINPEKEKKFIGVRTNEDRVISTLGANRISLVYVGLSDSIINTLNSPSERNKPVEIWKSSSISIFILPESGEASGTTGPYRNTRPVQSSFPIYQYEILGKYSQKENDIKVFVNGKPFLDNFTQQGNKIIFKFPLQPEDVVTVRVQPKFSLPIAEVETDDSGIIRIDNKIRQSVFDLDGNSLVYQQLLEHVHDGLEGSPEKILLSTETAKTNYSSNVGNKVYYFDKTPLIEKYDFNFSEDEFGIKNYEITVYINNLINIDPVTIVDVGDQIKLTFEDSLEDSDLVQISLRIKDSHTQIKNKIIFNDSNPSDDVLNVSVDAANISEGIIDGDLIPKISHIGINKEVLKPTNNELKDCVHRTERWNFNEYYPVFYQKNNARNAKFLFTESSVAKRSISSTKIFACGGNTALFSEVDDRQDNSGNIRWPLSSIEENKFFKGWDTLENYRRFGEGGNNKKFGEYGQPFHISPIKISGSKNWDYLFYTTPKFVYGINFNSSNLNVREIANLTLDNKFSESNLNLLGSNISKAESGKGILNIEKSQFIIIDNKVALLDIKESKFSWWNLTSDNLLWDSAHSITNLYDEDNFENNLLIVGASDDSDYCAYINPLAFVRLENNLDPAVQQGRIITNFSALPSDIWDYSDSNSTPFNAGDNVIFSSYNGVSERKTIFSANQSVINLPAEGGVSRIFEGKKNGLYNSVFIRDWVKIAENLDSELVKVLYYKNRLIFITKNNIYSSEEFSITEIYKLINSLTTPLSLSSGLTLIHSSSGINFNDAISVDSTIIMASNDGIYQLIINSFTPVSYSFSKLENSSTEYGSTINDMLSPCNRVFYDNNTSSDDVGVLYACTKFGIFKSKDLGRTWRNTIQILGQPVNRNSSYNNLLSSIKVVSKDKDKKRLYITNSFPIYGYGYGYGGELDYFNVFNINNSNYGYSLGEYGYGYGFELFNPFLGVEPNDWIFVSENSGNEYDSIPIKILGYGTENNAYYIDIELANGDLVNFNYIYSGQTFNIYNKVSPLPLIDNIPQSSIYGVSDAESYSVDYYRQSVLFDNAQDQNKIVDIASKFKYFDPITDFDRSNIPNNTSITINNITDLSEGFWTYNEDLGIFEFEDDFNYNNIIRVTVRGQFIYDIGKKDHIELEDEFSLNSLGLEYHFAGIRDSNLLQTVNRIKSYLKNNSLSYSLDSFSGEILSISNPSGSDDGFIETTSELSSTYSVNALVGRKVSINNIIFTISANTSDNKIYLQQTKTYENFTDEANSVKTTFSLSKGRAISDSFEVYINGTLITSWTPITSEGFITSFEMDSAPVPSDSLIVSYVGELDYIDLSSLIEIGDSFIILEKDFGVTENLIDVDCSNYDSNIFDLNDSFIENSTITENDSFGEISGASFGVYYDSSQDVFYYGTNVGIWKRDYNKNIYHKTAKLLSTLDATGTITVPNIVNGAYIQYNKDSEYWTVTWGGGAALKDENLNIDNIKISAIAVSPFDSSIVFAATEDCIFRSFDSGSSWECVFNISRNSRIENSPDVFQIVFDDKHPWVVNAVFELGLYRSIDYGSNWELVSGENSNDLIKHGGVSAFSYQKDNSDARSVYYYGKNKLYFNSYQEESPISYINKSHRTSSVIERENLFGFNYLDASFNAIVNNLNDVNNVYLSIDGYGVYKTNLLGNAKNITRGNKTYNKTYGFINGSTNSQTSGSQKVSALNDIVGSDEESFLPYEIYVDVENDKTYINLDIIGTFREIPLDNEFEGKFVKIPNANRSAFKILEHYDRGDVFGDQYYYDENGNILKSRRHEFVLSGLYPKTSDALTGAIYSELDNGDYYHPLDSNGRPTSMFIPIFKESNGGFGPIPLSSSDQKVYAVKCDMFNPGSLETVLIIENPSTNYYTQDALKDYLIGHPLSKSYYKIYASRLLEPWDCFYYKGSFGYGYGYGGGDGLDYFDVFGVGTDSVYSYSYGYGYDSFESDFSGIYGYGAGYELFNQDIIQLALRLETISDFEFGFKDDPYNLWHRYSYIDIHKTWRRQPLSIIDNNNNEILTLEVDSNESSSNFNRYKIEIVTSNEFVGHDQNAVYIYFENTPSSDSVLDYLKIDGAFAGRFIYNQISKNRYEIYNSKFITSGHILYDAERIGFLLQIEKYQSSYIDKFTIYSDGEIDVLSENVVTLKRSLGLESNSLVGYGLYVDQNYRSSYRIIENSPNSITLISSNIENIIDNDSVVNLYYGIPNKSTFDMVLGSSERLFATTPSGPYLSEDGAKTWKKIIDGLETDSLSDEPFAVIEKIKISEPYIIGASKTSGGYGGVYMLNTSSLSWSKIGIDDSEKVISIDFVIDGNSLIFYAGTENNGIYKGISSILTPTSVSWEKIYLPENNISAIETISTFDNVNDLDRIWIGTEGRGVFLRNKGETSWSEVSYNSIDNSISASNWQIWNIFNNNNYISVTALNRFESESIRDIEEYLYNQNYLENSLYFDWNLDSRVSGYSDKAYIYLLDPSSSDYILEKLPLTVSSESSRNYHHFDNFLSSVGGSESLSLEGDNNSIGNSLFKTYTSFSLGNLVSNLYESPFNHFPELSSIIKIDRLSDGRLLVVSDRNGVWRSISDGENIILPEPSGDYTADFGFDYDSGMLVDNPEGYVKAYRFYDESNETSNFEYELERTLYFDIGTGHAAYSSIDGLSDYTSVVGGFLVIDSVGGTEVSGINNSYSYKTYIIKTIEKDTKNNRFRLTVSPGKVNSNTDPQTRGDWSNIYERFSLSDIPVAQVGSKFFIVDFESYEKISDGIPNSNLIDSNGVYEKNVLIRDVALDSNSDACYLACGLKGLYYCSDLKADVVWVSANSPSADITSVTYKDPSVSDGDIFVGTWGDGVWTNVGGSWHSIGPNNHPYIWTVFTNSEISNSVFIGTEHGGVYKWNTSTESYEDVNGVIRSQIFVWKTIGVPVNLEGSLDYSNKDYLLSYSWGGGIMRSLDRGLSWQQINSGLKNIYIQDISISSNSSGKRVAYAATFGGGVFRCSDAFGLSPVWESCSQDDFPISKNVSEIAVGSDPDIAYAKIIENDISIKDIPFRYRNNSRTIKGFASGVFTRLSELNNLDYGNLVNKDNNYKLFKPYSDGFRKHSIYRTNSSGEFWNKVFDKTSESQSLISSAIFGLTMVPGESDKVNFISSFSQNVDVVGNQNVYASRVDFVSMSSGEISSETEISSLFNLANNSSGGPLTANAVFGEAFVSIDPANTQVIMLSIIPYYFDDPIIIMRSEDSGANWDHRVSILDETLPNGDYCDSIKFSTVSGIEESLTLSSDSSAFTVDGETSNILDQKQNFFWRVAENYYKNNSNRNFQLTVAFDSSGTNYNLFRMTDASEPANKVSGARPFYLNGASITPDVTNNENNSFTISNGGHGSFIPVDRDFVDINSSIRTSFVLSSEFNKDAQTSTSSTARLSGLTSIVYEKNSLPANSIFRQENALIGCEASFDSLDDNYTVAIHRIYEDSGTDYVQLIFVGEFDVSSGDTMTVSSEKPIYCISNNSLLASINNGLVWKYVDDADNFINSNIDVIGAVPLNASYGSGSGYDRIFYSLFKYNSSYNIARGVIDDGRYSDGAISDISWTLYSTIDNNYFLQDGLSVQEIDSSTANLYTSQYNKIAKHILSSTAVGAGSSVFDSTIYGNEVYIQYPLKFSELNYEVGVFIANDKIFYTLDNFASDVLSSELDDISGNDITSVHLGNAAERNVYVGVGARQSQTSITKNILFVEEIGNNNRLAVSNISDFTPSDRWIGRPVVFEGNDGSVQPYISRISAIQVGSVDLINTILGSVSEYFYNISESRTEIKFTTSQNFNTEFYKGNVFSIKNVLRETKLFEGLVLDIIQNTDNDFTLYVSGNISDIFTSFDTNSYQIKIGRIRDFLPRNYSGKLIATIINDNNLNNGIWRTSTLEGFERIDSLSYNEIDRPAGIGFFEFSNGSQIAALSGGGKTRLLINDEWFGSENINDIDIDLSNNLLISTDNGLSIANVSNINSEDLIFKNYYLDNISKGLYVESNKIYFRNSSGIAFISDIPDFRYYGGESVSATSLPLTDVSVSIETEDGIVWYGTQSSGIVAVLNNISIEINTNNSDIGSNSIKDMYVDSNGRIWVAYGENGAGYFDYIYTSNSISTNWTNFDAQSNNFSGSLNAIVQESGLNYEADGTGENPNIILNWSNTSETQIKSLLLRSSSQEDPLIDGLVYDFNALSGTISSVEEFSADGQDYYRITLTFQALTEINIDINSLVGKKILISANTNEEEREIVGNEGNNVIIQNLGSLQAAPTAGSAFLIADKVNGFNSYVIYVGDSLGISPEIVDESIVNNSTYYYRLYSYSDSTSIPEYNLIDSKSININDTTINNNSANPIVFIGRNGIYNFEETSSGSLFVLQKTLGNINNVNSAIIDSEGNIWICADNKIIKYSSPTENLVYFDKETIFGSDFSNEDLQTRKIVQDSNNNKYIATNFGLVIINANEIISTYIANDSKRVAQNSNDNWRPALFINEEFNFVKFIEKDSTSVYAIFENSTYLTENYGLTWSLVEENITNPEFVLAAKNNNDIIDYIFVNNDSVLSTSSDSINYNTLLEENIFSVSVSGNGVPGNLWLSESETNSDKIIFAGIVDNKITSSEKEIAKITLNSSLINGSFDYIGDSEGLSIQSIYCFDFVKIGAREIIFAGGKDNVIKSEDGGNSWTIIEIDNINNVSEQFAYTALAAYANSSALYNNDATLLATRTALFSGGMENNASLRKDKSLVSIRFDNSSNVIKQYDISSNLLTPNPLSSGGEIRITDGFGFGTYSMFPESRYDYISGHRGAIKILEDKNVMFVGGFNNSLMLFPFLSEDSSNLAKKNSFVYSGRRANGESTFPLSIPNDVDFHSSNKKTILENNIRPKSIWNIRFNQDNDLEGYANIFLFGSSSEENNYNYTKENNISLLSTTKDGGMFWQPDTSQNFPNILVTDMVIDNSEFVISSMVSTGEDIGVYQLNTETSSWVTDYSSSIPKVPTKEVERIDGEIFAGPLGFGLYKMSENLVGYGYGYGGHESLDYFNVFGEEGSLFGYAYGFDQSFYGYGQGVEVRENWSKVDARFVTEKGLGFGKWNVSSISQDKTNENRVIVGTTDRGIFEGIYNNEEWSWIQDSEGLNNGNITKVEILKTNPFLVLVGVANEGLYIKDLDLGTFRKASGLPEATVTDITIDENIRDIYTTFNFDNSSGDNILIVRSALEPVVQDPQDGVAYSEGDNIANGIVIYKGTSDFASNPFKDDDKSLRNGITYYYNFYTISVDNEYTEINTISGETNAVSSLSFTTANNSFDGLSLAGRVVELRNRLNGRYFYFKINSNTDNTISLLEDRFKIVNRGDATELKSNSVNYTVKSTIAVDAVESNPIYIVIGGDIYESIDNGSQWTLKSSSISENINSVTPISSGAVTTLFETDLYAATNSGVYYSANNGSSWSSVSGLLAQNYSRVWADLEDSKILYAITPNLFVYRSTDSADNWELLLSGSKTVNDSSVISYGTNYIYLALENDGINVVEDSIRGSMDVEIEVDGKITEFNINYFERGDSFFTDANSISCNTLFRNDSASDSREEITFKVTNNTKYLTFKFNKNNSLLDLDDIFVGSSTDNAYSNPVILENPKYEQDNIFISNIGQIQAGENYAITNRGFYTTEDNGDKWVKINSALIPEVILDASVGRDSELLLATEGKGLWGSKETRTIFRNIEQNGFSVKFVFEKNINGVRRIYRGGNQGLYITIERPLGRTMIVYSGPSFESGNKIELSWGSIFGQNDGSWSDATIRSLDVPILASPTPGKIESYEGWDEALIIRKGPYSTFEKAQSDALANNIFAPVNRIVYPSIRLEDAGFTFVSNNSSPNTEEIRDINLVGNGALGISLSPRAFMQDGSIVVGRIKNNSSEYPSSNNGPSTDKFVVDRVAPLSGASREAEGMGENFADESAYDSGEEKIPLLKDNKFYIYRIYPYREVPSSDILGASTSEGVFYPTHPIYLPSSGDLVDSYSFRIDIDKFVGAKDMLCAAAFSDGNWIAGTDAGVFFSNEEGMNIIKSDILQRKIPAIFVSSNNIVFIAMVGVSGIEIYKNSEIITSNNFDSTDSWTLVSEITQIFREVGVVHVYNFVEDELGYIYVSTNKGIFKGSLSGGYWARINSVGDVESIRSSRVLGQDFEIQ